MKQKIQTAESKSRKHDSTLSRISSWLQHESPPCFYFRIPCPRFSFRQQDWTGRCQSPVPASSFFLPLLNCSNVQLFQCFSTSSFRVLCSRFLLCRVKIRIFTLIEFLRRKNCKSGISFRRCQFAPCLIFPFFLPLLNCSLVQMFKCFPVPSYFRVPCSSVLTSRVKTKVFTLIELLIVIAIISIR